MNNAIMENIEGLKKLKELNLHNVQKQLIIYSLAPNILKDMHKREKHFKKKEKEIKDKIESHIKKFEELFIENAQGDWVKEAKDEINDINKKIKNV